ncbi:ATP-dependent RNA helicase DDX1 [Podarcis lilfordi]|uniref:ATP-dependent RNA helicase n=1 Tax=Podarcis lilfordi TaxID=74358 RepID=A0AA35K2F6_9SAUR|nr:ATP-dependent RNA helicase DDX1 [Podarcis lilfordi]
MAAFSEMGVMPEIAQAVEEMDWLLPTDIQAESIPLILGGGDVLMAAETGSGKTGAFSIPVIQIVYETLKDQQEGKKGKTTIKTGGGVLNKWQMNPYDRGSAFAIGSDGLCCQSREIKEWHGCRSTKGVTKGKYYYEVSCRDQGLCRVGWSSMQASLDLGTDKFGFGYGGTGKKSHNKQFDSYGEEFTMHDTIGCYVDVDKGQIMFSKNGKDLGLAFEIPQHLKNQALFAACVLKNAELKFNFGEEDFKFPPKDGFVALDKAPEGNSVKSQHAGSAQVAQTKNQPNAPKALIVEPSRELAEQTLNNVKQFKKYVDNPKLRELLIIGGVAAREQLSVLEQGVDIVVGTPGRLDDLVSTGKLTLSQVRFLVLDEADGLLSQGYSDFINRIHSQIPQITSDGKRLQVIVCSATLHSFDVKKLSEKIMHFPTWVDLKGEDSVPDTVHHVVVPVNPKNDKYWEKIGKNHIRTDEVHAKDNTRPGTNSAEMWSEAIKILKGEYTVRAIKEHKMDQAIIFCRTKIDCDNMEQYFMQQGGGPDRKGHQFSCVCLHGDRKPHERKQNLERFKKGDVRFLICTDVAARGIDISGVPYVINVTLPDEKQNYVHRIGRVGRAERMGLAISLVATEKEKVWYHSCPSRGKGCYNTRLKDEGGCTIWYNEMQVTFFTSTAKSPSFFLCISKIRPTWVPGRSLNSGHWNTRLPKLF